MLKDYQIIDCNECNYINITEEEQNLKKKNDNKLIHHRCISFDTILLHEGEHPRIVPCKKCSGIYFGARKVKREYSQESKFLAHDLLVKLMNYNKIQIPWSYCYSPLKFREQIIEAVIRDDDEQLKRLLGARSEEER